LTAKLKFLEVDVAACEGAAAPDPLLPELPWLAQPATNNANPAASANPIFRFMASSFNLGTPPLLITRANMVIRRSFKQGQNTPFRIISKPPVIHS
jgi:hypothetical protein